MKKSLYQLVIIISIILLAGCTPLVKHTDPFYDYNDSDFPRDHLPLINPVEATRERPSNPWRLVLLNSLYIDLPKIHEQDILQVYTYYSVEELEKFAIKDGVIMAYSLYDDLDADPYVLNDYYHWFVMVPSKDMTEGFHTEEEFTQYIGTLGIQDPVWQTPDDAFDRFLETGGCMDWIPDCK